MAEFYCIVDITDPDNLSDAVKAVDGLVDMSLEDVENWITSNQTDDKKYKVMRHNDLTN
jgi:hypothetical protein